MSDTKAIDEIGRSLPWKVAYFERERIWDVTTDRGDPSDEFSVLDTEDDRVVFGFIVAACNAYPALLSRIEELERALEESVKLQTERCQLAIRP